MIFGDHAEKISIPGKDIIQNLSRHIAGVVKGISHSVPCGSIPTATLALRYSVPQHITLCISYIKESPLISTTALFSSLPASSISL